MKASVSLKTRNSSRGSSGSVSRRKRDSSTILLSTEAQIHPAETRPQPPAPSSWLLPRPRGACSLLFLSVCLWHHSLASRICRILHDVPAASNGLDGLELESEAMAHSGTKDWATPLRSKGNMTINYKRCCREIQECKSVILMLRIMMAHDLYQGQPPYRIALLLRASNHLQASVHRPLTKLARNGCKTWMRRFFALPLPSSCVLSMSTSAPPLPSPSSSSPS